MNAIRTAREAKHRPGNLMIFGDSRNFTSSFAYAFENLGMNGYIRPFLTIKRLYVQFSYMTRSNTHFTCRPVIPFQNFPAHV